MLQKNSLHYYYDIEKTAHDKQIVENNKMLPSKSKSTSERCL